MSIASIALIILSAILLIAIIAMLFGWNLAEAITDLVEAFFDAFNND
jgi:hypothetical protein